MAYKGRFLPKNISKYVGDFNKITYRSLWERKFMNFCDDKPEVLKWGSETVVVKYLSPIDGEWHRYYVDFIVEIKKPDGTNEIKLIEIKPKKQCSAPKKPSKGINRKYITEVKRWGINSAKWKYATEFANNRGWDFIIMNEDHLLV